MNTERKNIASMIDHTLLKPDATRLQIDQLCGEAVTYTNWRSGQPDDAGSGEDAGELFVRSGSGWQAGEWNDNVASNDEVSLPVTIDWLRRMEKSQKTGRDYKQFFAIFRGVADRDALPEVHEDQLKQDD